MSILGLKYRDFGISCVIWTPWKGKNKKNILIMFLKLDGNYYFPTFYQISEKLQAYKYAISWIKYLNVQFFTILRIFSIFSPSLSRDQPYL